MSASVVGLTHWCFLFRISDTQRVAVRETLRYATMTYHSATQNCICKPARDWTLLWVGAFVLGACLVAWHHLIHWRKAVKVEEGRDNDRLCNVLIMYHSAAQHCICEHAGDLTFLWVGASVFGASLVAWHHLTHSRAAVKVEHGGAGDRLRDVLISCQSAPHRLRAKAFSKLRKAPYFPSFCICKKVNSGCQFSRIYGSARPAGALCDTQSGITEHTFAGPQFSGLRKCLHKNIVIRRFTKQERIRQNF